MKSKKKNNPNVLAFFPSFFFSPPVLFNHLRDAKKKGGVSVLLGFIPFNLKPKQTPKPHAGYKIENPALFKS